jgi:hypothetical protein
MEEREIINRVQSSGLVTLNLEDYYEEGERLFWDVKEMLYQGLILKEKDFRQYIKEEDVSRFKNKNVAIGCSADAIIPSWAYMIAISKLQPIAKNVIVGDLDTLETYLFAKGLSKIKIEDYRDCKVVIKGCGKIPVPIFAYGEVTRMLIDITSSIMYGEPCSTVPVFKRKSK